MKNIFYFNRIKKQECKEEVYGKWALSLLYGSTIFARIFAFLFLPLLSRWPFFSKFYGYLQKRPSSRRKIVSFISEFHIDVSEFAAPLESFRSFNDFFIRKLKPEKRPIDARDQCVIAPADGRYLVIPEVRSGDRFRIKEQTFHLYSFLHDPVLANQFQNGSMVLARLNPTDYHRFHFPVSGKVVLFQEIPGHLYSVNPWAIQRHPSIFWKNKRCLTVIRSEQFGDVLMVEIGATCVGTIHQTFSSKHAVRKGEEKGFFSFGGSSVVLLFEKNRIIFDSDLLEQSSYGRETKCQMGQSIACIK